MVVYLINCKLDTRLNYLCVNKEIAERERIKLSWLFGLDKREMEEFIEMIEMDLIEE